MVKTKNSDKYKLLFLDLLNRVIDDSYKIKKNGDIAYCFNYVNSVKILRESVKYVQSGNEKEKYLRYLKFIDEIYKYCLNKIEEYYGIKEENNYDKN